MLSFFLFGFICLIIIGILFILLKIFLIYGKSDADEFRVTRCPGCDTDKKPQKTGDVRNLVELKLRCPICGYISWDIPPKTNLSKRSSDIDNIT